MVSRSKPIFLDRRNFLTDTSMAVVSLAGSSIVDADKLAGHCRKTQRLSK